MEFAIAKETKTGENRVILTPNDVKKLTDKYHVVYVEKGAGVGAGFPDTEYEKVGAKIVENVYDKPIILRVKEPPLETIKDNQIIIGYLHIEKNQNPELLAKLKEKKVTAYAIEELRDMNGRRLVSLGFEAGIVGMFEGLRLYGQKLEKSGKYNPLSTLKPIKEYSSKKEIYLALRQIFDFNAQIAIAGYGQVSRGAQEVLAQLSCPAKILKEEDTLRTNIMGKEYSYIWKVLPNIDIFLNAIVWKPGQSRVLTCSDIGMMKNGAIIIDVSCDKNGGIETCMPTSWDNPTYDNNKVTHYCVDNLPSALANESSIVLSESIIPHLLKFGDGIDLPSGLMTKNGEFVFK